MARKLTIRIEGDYKGQGFQQAKGDVDELTGVTGKLATLAGGALVAGLAAAGAAAAEFAGQSLESFKSFEKGMKEVYTLLPGQTKGFYDELSKQARTAAAEMGRMPDEVVPALYQSLSAGVPPDNVFDFMETANAAALGGVTTLETAVDGISSVINAYGTDVIEAAEASDLMFTAVKGGKTTFDELSKSLFNVVPVASAIGVEFGNVTAALAAMTAQGVPTSVATTQLRQLLVELSKSGTEVNTVFQEMAGVGFNEFIAQGGNLQQALQILEGAASDMGVGVNELFGSVEAGNAALALTGSGTEKFAQELENAANAANATADAAQTMEGGLQRTEERVGAATERLKLLVGEGLAPAKQAWLEFKLSMVESAADMIETQQTIDEIDSTAFDLTSTFYDAASASGQLTDGFTGAQDSASGAEEALAKINGTFGAYSSSVEEAEARNRALNAAMTLLENGYQGTGAALAEAAIEMARNGEVTRLTTDDIIEQEMAARGLTEAQQDSAEAIRTAAQERARAAGTNDEFADKLVQTNSALSEEEAALARSAGEHRARTEALAESTQQQQAMAEAVQTQIGLFQEAETLAAQLMEAQASGGAEEVAEVQEAIQESYRASAFEAMLAGAQTEEAFAQALEAGVAIGAISQEQANAQMAIAGTEQKINELNAMLANGSLNASEYAAAFATVTGNLNASAEAAANLAKQQAATTEALVEGGASGVGDYYRDLAESAGGDDGEGITITPEVDTTVATAAFEELSAQAQAYAAEVYIATPEADTAQAEGSISTLQSAADEVAGTYTLTFNVQQSGSIPSGVGAPGRARGGPVEAGRMYTVGEEGPELFVPGTNGRILNAQETAAVTNSSTLNAPINVYVQSGNPQQIAEAIQRELLGVTRRMGVRP